MFRSARARRRAAWAAVLVSFGGVAAGGLASLPTAPSPRATSPARAAAPAPAPTEPAHVPMTAARRRAITELVDAFVPAAVERRNLGLAHRLTTPSFRAGISRAEWDSGSIPIHPFDARTERHYAWRLNYSWPREISAEVFLQPSKREQLGAIAFTAVFVRRGATWKVDEFVTSATFAPEKKAPRILASPDFQPNMIEGARTRSRLGATWLLLPVAVLALIAVVPLIVLVRTKRVERRAMRNYRALYDRAS